MAKKGKRIILNEVFEAEEILSSPLHIVDYTKLLILAKYYDEKGCNKKEIENKILEYCSKDENFNLYFFREMIERVLKNARKRSIKNRNQNVAITKNEVSRLKILPHKIYRIALYMLFIAKFEKYQRTSIDKNKTKKSSSFKTYCNHSIETIVYSLENSRGLKNKLSEKEERYIARILLEKEIAKPVYLVPSFEILIADFESKDVEFAIESELDFESQIKYYCVKCGNGCKKSKKHDFCDTCFRADLRSRKTESMRRIRQ